jgi:hypothetical protein
VAGRPAGGFRAGKLAAARSGWQEILDLPAAQHRQRAVWAAWMLAKTAPDIDSALPFYQKTRELAAAGCRDALGLAPVALGWLAWHEPDPVAARKMYFEAACSGNESMLVSVRQKVATLLGAGEQTLACAAADPLAREIVTATLFARRDGPYLEDDDPDPDADSWLALLEAHPAA